MNVKVLLSLSDSLVDYVLDSVQDAWASVSIALANHKIKIITQVISIWWADVESITFLKRRAYELYI
jgi:hypothetical protein